MENIYDMIVRVDFLVEVRENEKNKAAERLQDEMRIFVAHYGQASTDECPSTWCTYVLLREGNGNVLVKNDEDEDKVEVENLTLKEMEFLREFMVEHINHDLQILEDEIERYQDLY